MHFDPHGRLGKEPDDLITQLVGERAVLVGVLRFVAPEHLHVPQHVGVGVLAGDDEPVVRPGLLGITTQPPAA
jgi:hypothetical protein